MVGKSRQIGQITYTKFADTPVQKRTCFGRLSKDRPRLSVQHRQEFFQWQALPFGLNIAPREWQRLMQAIVNRLRRKKMNLWCYLGDFIIMGRTWHKTFHHTLELVRLLLKVGLEINHRKSVLSPTQRLVCMGFKLNFVLGLIQIPRDKLKSVVKDLDRVRRAEAPSVRRCAVVLGRIRALLPVLLHLRPCMDALAIHVANSVWYDCESHHPMHQRVRTQLEEACTQLASWKGKAFHASIQAEMHCYSDASDWAWGANSPGVGGVFGFFTN